MARSQVVQLVWTFENLSDAAKTGYYRHLTRKHGTQRIDSLDLQPGRIVKQIPTVFVIASQNRARKFSEAFLVRIFKRRILVSIAERRQHPLFNLARGFPSER